MAFEPNKNVVNLKAVAKPPFMETLNSLIFLQWGEGKKVAVECIIELG